MELSKPVVLFYFIDGMYNHTHLIKHLLMHKDIIAILRGNTIISQLAFPVQRLQIQANPEKC